MQMMRMLYTLQRGSSTDWKISAITKCSSRSRSRSRRRCCWTRGQRCCRCSSCSSRFSNFDPNE